MAEFRSHDVVVLRPGTWGWRKRPGKSGGSDSVERCGGRGRNGGRAVPSAMADPYPMRRPLRSEMDASSPGSPVPSAMAVAALRHSCALRHAGWVAWALNPSQARRSRGPARNGPVGCRPGSPPLSSLRSDQGPARNAQKYLAKSMLVERAARTSLRSYTVDQFVLVDPASLRSKTVEWLASVEGFCGSFHSGSGRKVGGDLSGVPGTTRLTKDVLMVVQENTGFQLLGLSLWASQKHRTVAKKGKSSRTRRKEAVVERRKECRDLDRKGFLSMASRWPKLEQNTDTTARSRKGYALKPATVLLECWQGPTGLELIMRMQELRGRQLVGTPTAVRLVLVRGVETDKTPDLLGRLMRGAECAEHAIHIALVGRRGSVTGVHSLQSVRGDQWREIRREEWDDSTYEVQCAVVEDVMNLALVQKSTFRNTTLKFRLGAFWQLCCLSMVLVRLLATLAGPPELKSQHLVSTRGFGAEHRYWGCVVSASQRMTRDSVRVLLLRPSRLILNVRDIKMARWFDVHHTTSFFLPPPSPPVSRSFSSSAVPANQLGWYNMFKAIVSSLWLQAPQALVFKSLSNLAGKLKFKHRFKESRARGPPVWYF
ncbi:hypothetical protein DFH09DRAFT_1296678 [Mycena vulgaris]|nr:hypothetical protein DFH09DRAFT_1296678 [Mycena vulgaris]